MNHHLPTIRAFSLIELMIVLAIIAILTAVAYPSYSASVQKANRADGQTALLELSAELERFYTENLAYNDAGNPAAAAYDSPEGHYRISQSSLTATTFVIIATAQGGQANDTDCATLSLDNLAQKSPAACW